MPSYRKGLKLSLGSVIQTQVDLHAALSSRESTGLKRLCREHHQPLNMVHRCPSGEHLLEWGDWDMGYEDAQGWHVVPAVERPEFPAADSLHITPVPISELADNTMDGESIYYCKPTTSADEQAWKVLLDVASKGKVALVTKGSLRRGPTEKMWRLDSFRGYLVLREIVYPNEIREAPEAPQVKTDKAIGGLVTQFIDQLMSSWDKLDTTNAGAERMKQWLSQGTLVAAASPEQTQGTPVTSLTEALRAAVEKTKKSA